MHCYSYDGYDSDSPGSGPLSGSDSETSSAQSQRSLIILLDDDDDETDGLEQPVHPVPSRRPKRPLPRNFSGRYHSPLKEEKDREVDVSCPEVYHTISCTPGLRDKSLEELRVECYLQSRIATRQPPRPVGSGTRGIPPSFLPWHEPEGKTVSSASQSESSAHDIRMGD